MKLMMIGYTRTDRDSDYVPAVHGYRKGAKQGPVVKIEVDDTLLEPVNGEEWAEAVFVATNAPEAVIRASAPASAVLAALVKVMAEGTKIRPLGKGDTVIVDEMRYACAGDGWDEFPFYEVTAHDEMEASRLTASLGFLVTPQQVAKDRIMNPKVTTSLDDSQGDAA